MLFPDLKHSIASFFLLYFSTIWSNKIFLTDINYNQFLNNNGQILENVANINKYFDQDKNKFMVSSDGPDKIE